MITLISKCLPKKAFVSNFLALVLCLQVGCGADYVESVEAVPMVKDGVAVGKIVIPRGAPGSVRELANDFQKIVERSTGARLPILTDDQKEKIEDATSLLFLGECQQTIAAGLRMEDLAEEAYRIAVRGSSIFVLGEPAKPTMRPFSTKDAWYDSDPMRWAINGVLEKQLGVRWLWPGDLGTYVPRHQDFTFPAGDRTYQPRLKMRTLVIQPMREANEQVIRKEALKWVSNHQGGERGKIPLNHAFDDWWDKYREKHPDYFVKPPAGQAEKKPPYFKLSLGNPKVLDQIVADYEAAGRPRYWNVTPNDGVGFDVSDEVRSWDIPADQPVMDIWNGKANLTARYVKWWNLVYERLAAMNPDVTLVTMAYSCYENPPPVERPLKARSIIGVVPDFRSYDVWSGWAAQADEFILRPNWGWYGANAPYLPLREMAGYLKFASENKLVGFYLDAIIGFWGTQGLNYYLLARLMAHSELSVEEIVTEYCSAFGAGAPKIREYFDYWQKLAEEWPQGYGKDRVLNGKYDALVKQGKIMDNPFIGPRQALRYIYTDEVLQQAFGLLDEADALIGNIKSEEAERVDFLRQGLNEMKIFRDALTLGEQLEKSPTPELMAQFKKKIEALDKLRSSLSPKHVIWGGVVNRLEDKYGIKVRMKNLEIPTAAGDEQF